MHWIRPGNGMSRHDFAIERIREYILTTNLKAGDLLPSEKMLEDLLQLSRTSIREALRSMEAKGIIETHQGQGRFLRSYNYDGIVDNLSYMLEVNTKHFKEVIDIRIALELHFLETLTPSFTPAGLETIRSKLAVLKECSLREDENEDELIELHKNFHLSLYENADNQLLLHLIGMFSDFQRTLVHRQEYPRMNTPDFYMLHEQLFEAIISREPFLVRTKLVEHFRDVISWTRENS